MRHIRGDYHKVKGAFNRYASLCVGAGRAGEVLRHAFLKHLEEGVRDCGFSYLRFHGIFHEDMGVYGEDEKGRPRCSWQYVDMVYDALLERGIKPFVELSFMPSALASGDKTVFWWKANVTPPKDYDKWGSLIFAFVKHLEERYGREEVASWYFEVWNEPNHPAFFGGTRQDYFRLYEVTARAVKAVCPGYRVGGPATAAGDAWISEFIAFCHDNRVPSDFVSTHIYGVEGAFDEFGDSVLYLSKNRKLIPDQVREVCAKVKASPMPDLEIHYTEWSSSYSSRDPVHDHYSQAAYILRHLKGLEGLVASMSYWTLSDIFEEVGPPQTPFHGGFGLINAQGLKKPSHYAYAFLNRLGDTELFQEDKNAWLCKKPGGIQALFWNDSPVCQDEPNHLFFKKDRKAEKAEEVEITLSGLPEGDYALEIRRIGYDRNDVYTGYLKLGAPASPSREQIQLLSRENDGMPEIKERIRVGENGLFQYRLELNENDVVLLTLELIGGNETC